jgi:enoyl reductase-like protein
MHEITKKQDRILDEALVIFGRDYQLVMCVEEMSELTQELCKIQRDRLSGVKRINLMKLLDELADVIITTREIEMMFDDRHTLQERIDYKIQRLADRNKTYMPPINNTTEESIKNARVMQSAIFDVSKGELK